MESAPSYFLSDLSVLRLEVAGDQWRRRPSAWLLFSIFLLGSFLQSSMPFLQITDFLGLEMQKGIVVISVPTVINGCFQAFRGRSCSCSEKKSVNVHAWRLWILYRDYMYSLPISSLPISLCSWLDQDPVRYKLWTKLLAALEFWLNFFSIKEIY